MNQDIFASYEILDGVPSKLIPRIRKLCGVRYIDLLLHLPASTIRRYQVESISKSKLDEINILKVKVLQHRVSRNRRMPHTVVVSDADNPDNDIMELIFFNGGAWLSKQYPEGREFIISGTIINTLTGRQIVHPELHKWAKNISDIPELQVVYPLTAGVTNPIMTNAVKNAWEKLLANPPVEWLPEKSLKEFNFPTFIKALEELHYPILEGNDTTNINSKNNIDNASNKNSENNALTRLAFDELFSWQVALADARSEGKALQGIAHGENYAELRKKFLAELPFGLTGDQQKVIAEIDSDMTAPEPMTRLVQGDVGSGKTVVAFASLLRSIADGMQGALMAPTEILALQHLENARKWLEPLGIKVALLTGKLKAKEKREIKAQLASGEINLVIGTHALIQEDVIFKKIGLVVIDEQHRFGVKQRLAMTSQAETPDLLVMTATPIPRTLALTYYGDMDISIIREKPPGRTPIETRALPISRMEEVSKSLQRLIDKGEQAYWVCPLVEESMKSDLAAASERFDTLQEIYGEQVTLLHGRMKAKEKEEAIAKFRDKESQSKILVATTVIEVGVDVPQSTVMVIEHAERFGLSQLHQLRGRIGRGSLKSNCILLYGSPLSEYARQRIKSLRETDDGFILAEMDLKLRGPGEALGTQQSGRNLTRIADLYEQRDLIPLARDLAIEITENKDKKTTNLDSLEFLLKTFHKDKASELIKAG